MKNHRSRFYRVQSKHLSGRIMTILFKYFLKTIFVAVNHLPVWQWEKFGCEISYKRARRHSRLFSWILRHFACARQDDDGRLQKGISATREFDNIFVCVFFFDAPVLRLQSSSSMKSYKEIIGVRTQWRGKERAHHWIEIKYSRHLAIIDSCHLFYYISDIPIFSSINCANNEFAKMCFCDEWI